MGVSFSPMYATGILWSEKYICITNKIGAAFSFFGVTMQNAIQAVIGMPLFSWSTGPENNVDADSSKQELEMSETVMNYISSHSSLI